MYVHAGIPSWAEAMLAACEAYLAQNAASLQQHEAALAYALHPSAGVPPLKTYACFVYIAKVPRLRTSQATASLGATREGLSKRAQGHTPGMTCNQSATAQSCPDLRSGPLGRCASSSSQESRLSLTLFRPQG